MTSLYKNTEKRSVIKELKLELEEYKDIEWLSSTNIRTKITEMSNDYLLNVLKKVAQKSLIANNLKYVEEVQMYDGITYQTWTRYFYSQYLYRKYENIVIEDNVKPTNFTQEAQDFLDISYPQNNNGVYKIC